MSTKEFLFEKASNFQAFLKQHSDPQHHTKLEQYKPEDLLPVLETHLVPLFQLGQIMTAVEKIGHEFAIVDGEVLKKIERYLTCFCEVYLS